MIWFVIYLLAIAIFYCLFIASGSDHDIALMCSFIWPVTLTIMAGGLLAGLLFGLGELIKDKMEKNND